MSLNAILIGFVWMIPSIFMLMVGQWELVNADPFFVSNYTYIFEAVTAWIAAALCFWSANVFGKLDDNRKAWRYVGLSAILWGIGQLVLTYRDCFYEAVTGTPLALEASNLARNMSDVFFILSIPVLALGFYYLWKTYKTSIPLYGWVIAAIVFFGSLILSIYNNWSLIFPADPALAKGVDELIFTILYAVLYPILLSYAVLMVSIILTGIIGRPWILVTIGVIVYSIGEIVWYNIEGFYVAGGYIDLLWIVGFMLIGVGAYINYYTIKHPY